MSGSWKLYKNGSEFDDFLSNVWGVGWIKRTAAAQLSPEMTFQASENTVYKTEDGKKRVFKSGATMNVVMKATGIKQAVTCKSINFKTGEMVFHVKKNKKST